MAIIAMFYGIIISMYFFDNRRHKIPHSHIKYQDEEAVLSIPDGEMLEGKIKSNGMNYWQIGNLPARAKPFSRLTHSSRCNMNPRVVEVHPNKDFTITITFANGEVRCFDVKPYLDKGIFRELKDPCVFNTVKPILGSIQWQGGQDFCPDTLYMDSESVVLLQTSANV